jgi:hypothetical protein
MNSWSLEISNASWCCANWNCKSWYQPEFHTEPPFAWCPQFGFLSTAFNICVRSIASVSILTNPPRWRGKRERNSGSHLPEKEKTKLSMEGVSVKSCSYNTDTMSGLRTPSTYSPIEFHNVTVTPNINKRLILRNFLEEVSSWKCRKLKIRVLPADPPSGRNISTCNYMCRALLAQY